MPNKKLHLPLVVFEKLYELLVSTLKTRLAKEIKIHLQQNGKVKISTTELWGLLRRHSGIYHDLFQSSQFSYNYFLRLTEKGNTFDDLVSIDRNMFCDALQFIGYKLPNKKGSSEPDKDRPYSYRLDDWGSEFLEKYFPNRTDFVDLVVRGKIIKEPKLKRARSKVPNDKCLALSGKIFISEVRQGDVIDKAVFTITLTRDGHVDGQMEVLYVNEITKRYNSKTYPLILRGELLYDKVILLIYENPQKEQAGVFNLKIESNYSVLTGTYVAHYESMHPHRKSRIGRICLVESTSSEAKKFLSQSKGMPMARQAKQFIPKPEPINRGQSFASIDGI